MTTALDRLKTASAKLDRLETADRKSLENPGEQWDTAVDELRNAVAELLGERGRYMLVPTFVTPAEQARIDAIETQLRNLDSRPGSEMNQRVKLIGELGDIRRGHVRKLEQWLRDREKPEAAAFREQAAQMARDLRSNSGS